ncbi:MAG: alkaline phosphatase family protein [Candidatus Abyssubacteria bacterium]
MLNIPLTYPPPKVQGFVIPGIPASAGDEGFCHPREIFERIKEVVGEYQVDRDFRDVKEWEREPNTGLERYRRLIEDLMAIEDKRFKLAAHLQKELAPDLFIVIFTLLDRLQHYFWRFGDPKHPHYSPDGNQLFGRTIEDGYARMDEMIGELIRDAGEGANIILLSDHGFGPYHKDFYLNKWLIDNGYMVVRHNPRLTLQKRKISEILERRGRMSKNSKLLRWLPDASIPIPFIKRRPDANDIVWSKTKAYTSMYGLRINLKGRECCGIVEPGVCSDQLRAEIKRKLESLTHGEEKIQIMAGADLYRGPQAHMGPDLFLKISDFRVVASERVDAQQWFDTGFDHAFGGTHRVEGIFLASGPTFHKSRLDNLTILDVAPTILYLMGIPIPSCMDGNVITELFPDQYLQSHPPRFDKPDTVSNPSHNKDAYAPEEERRIMDSLRGLGYIDE